MAELIKDKDKNKEREYRYKVLFQKRSQFLAVNNRGMPSSAKLVLLYLLGRLGGKNYAWPSVKKIAHDLGLGTRAITNMLKKLHDAGYLRHEKGGLFPDHDGNLVKKRSNKYYLDYFLVGYTPKKAKRVKSKKES